LLFKYLKIGINIRKASNVSCISKKIVILQLKKYIDMVNKSFKNVFAVVVAVMLVIALQIVQSGISLPSYKFWICFAIIVAALCYIVYVTFEFAKSLRNARKEITKLSQQVTELTAKEDLDKTQNQE